MHNQSNLPKILAAKNCHMESQSRCENNQAYWEKILLWSKLKVKVDYRGTSWRLGPTWSCAAWSWTSARSRCSRAARTAAGRRAAKAEPFAAEASRLLERKEKILVGVNISTLHHTCSTVKLAWNPFSLSKILVSILGSSDFSQLPNGDYLSQKTLWSLVHKPEKAKAEPLAAKASRLMEWKEKTTIKFLLNWRL